MLCPIKMLAYAPKLWEQCLIWIKDATDFLSRALQDTSVDVRIAAVDKAGGNADILERALADSDASVSGYAAANWLSLNNSWDTKQSAWFLKT